MTPSQRREFHEKMQAAKAAKKVREEAAERDKALTEKSERDHKEELLELQRKAETLRYKADIAKAESKLRELSETEEDDEYIDDSPQSDGEDGDDLAMEVVKNVLKGIRGSKNNGRKDRGQNQLDPEGAPRDAEVIGPGE